MVGPKQPSLVYSTLNDFANFSAICTDTGIWCPHFQQAHIQIQHLTLAPPPPTTPQKKKSTFSPTQIRITSAVLTLFLLM